MELIPFIKNIDSASKAITLLNQATDLDSTYVLGYYNKLPFYYQLQQFDKAIVAVNKLIALKPLAHDLYLTAGMLYEKTGDTKMAKNHFEKAVLICTKVLDTMNRHHRDYDMLVGNKVIALRMLGDSINANETIKMLSGEGVKEMMAPLLNKTKDEWLQQFTGQRK